MNPRCAIIQYSSVIYTAVVLRRARGVHIVLRKAKAYVGCYVHHGGGLRKPRRNKYYHEEFVRGEAMRRTRFVR